MNTTRRFERIEAEELHANTGRHKAIRVGEHIFKVCFERLSVTKFNQAIALSTSNGGPVFAEDF